MSQPFFRKQTKCWYVWENKGAGRKCIRLAKDKDEAHRLWHERQIQDQPVNDTTVSVVVTQFLNWCKRHREDSTYKWYCQYLTSFINRLGHLKVSDLKTPHIESWLDDCYGDCSNNGRIAAIRCAVRPFNWAVKRGSLDRNPIVGLERPRAESREVYIHPEQWQRIMKTTDGNLYDFLTILRETGCRPFEARTVEARHVDRALRAWVFSVEESKGKKTRRVVYLTDAAWELTQRLMLKNPTGPLFLNERGKPWTKNAVVQSMRRLKRRTGIECTAYSIRHTFVTDSLTKGVDPVTVANLVGHTSLEMIMKVYAHLQLRPDHMRAALEKAVS